MKFYAVGNLKAVEKDEEGKDVHVNKNVVIDMMEIDASNSRISAVNEATYYGRKEGITGIKVYPIRNTERGGDVMTKDAEVRRKKVTEQHKRNRMKKLAKVASKKHK